MNDHNVIMTVQGKKMLEEELGRLIKVDREQIKKAIAQARALGDLKEKCRIPRSQGETSPYRRGGLWKFNRRSIAPGTVDVSSLSGEKIVFGATVTLYNPKKKKA